MLTTTSGINNLTGYQVHLNVLNAVQSSDQKVRSSQRDKENSDSVNISSKARELQQTFQAEKSALEQSYNSDAQQLEREYLQEKNRLEREFRQEKQNLETDIYA